MTTAVLRFRELCARVRAFVVRPVRPGLKGSVARGERAAACTPSPRWKHDRRDVENHPVEDLFFKGPEMGHGYIFPRRKSRLIFVVCGPYADGEPTPQSEMYLRAVGLINRKGRRIRGAVPPAIHAVRFPMSAIMGDVMDMRMLDPEEVDAAQEILEYFREIRELASLPCS